MNLLKGSFRVSIVAAVAAAIYASWANFQTYTNERRQHHRLVSTLKCGALIAPDILDRHKNEFGNVDLGKLGCSNRSFWASISEINDASAGKLDGERANTYRPFDAESSVGWALIVFLLVNISGLAAVGGCYVYRWVRQGFAKD